MQNCKIFKTIRLPLIKARQLYIRYIHIYVIDVIFHRIFQRYIRAYLEIPI